MQKAAMTALCSMGAVGAVAAMESAMAPLPRLADQIY